MRSVQSLRDIWRGNSPEEWATAAVILLVTFGILLLVRRLLVARLGAVAKRTATNVDDLAVELIARTRAYFLFFVAMYVATRSLAIPDSADVAFETVTILVLLLQIGVWGNTSVDFWGKRYLDRQRASGAAASVATISALSIAAKIGIWLVILITALARFKVNVSALIASLGVGGIAIALAVQNVLGDLLAALSIVFDKPFDIGDVIVVGDVSGTVERIGMKTTRVRSASGEQVIVPNSDLVKGRIHNFKRMYERRVAFTTDVSYDTPPAVMERIPGILGEIVMAQTPVRFDRSHFASFTEAALRFETVYYVLDPDYKRYMDIQQRVYLEVLRRFEAEDISFAIPTHQVHVASLPAAPIAPVAAAAKPQ